MGKTLAEPTFGRALREMDLLSVVYKPPDDARTWKPCDFMVWFSAPGTDDTSAWFEVKDVDLVSVFPLHELRASQLAGIRDAARVGIPYYLAVWWRKAQMWSISDAIAVVKWWEEAAAKGPVTSIKRELLQSRFGIDSTNAQLSSNLKALILDGVS